MFASFANFLLCKNTFGRQTVVKRRQSSEALSTVLRFAVGTLAILISLQVCAQTNYTSSDQTVDGVSLMPTPGGHDYQHLLSETVTPSNGQVGFRVQYPMPKGRGISFPYWYGYNSAGLYRMFFQVGQNTLTWITNDLNFNGSGPVATWQVTLNPSQTYLCGPPNSGIYCSTWPCYQATGFTFYDMSGTNHTVYGMNALAPQGTPPTPTEPPQWYGMCASPSSGGAGGGSDGEVTAQFTTPSQTVSSLSSTGTIGAFTVTDKDGTTYFFGGGSPTLRGGVFEASPTKIEDRNGNIIFGANGNVDTLQRTIATPPQGGAQTIGGIPYPAPTAPSGAPSSVSVSYSVPTSLNTNPCFIMSGVNIGQVTGSQAAWTGVALPDGTQYTLFYGTYNPNDSTLVNNYGLLNEVVFPGGGWIKYQWSVNSSVANEIAQFAQLGTNTNGVNVPCYIGYSTPRLAHRYVSFDGVNLAEQQDYTYTTTWSSSGSTGFFSPAGWTSKTTTVVTTDKVKGQNFQTVYTYVPLGPLSQITDGPEIPVEQTVQYYDWGNAKLLKTVNKTWAGLSAMTCEVTTINGLTAGHVYQYGASPMVLSELTDDKEYDWSTSTPSSICGGTSTAPLKREKILTYQSFLTAATPYNPSEGEPGGVFYKPATVKTHDGSGNPYAETDYSYDQFSLASMSGVVQHDDGIFTTGETVRGNVTTITKQCFGCASGNAVTTLTYDQTGQVASQIDPCGNTSCSDVTGSNHTTTYSFVDSSPGNPAGQSNAYLTTVTFPQTGTTVHKETFAYNYTLGYLTTSWDENNQFTSYQYGTKASGCSFADNFERLTEIDYPDGGSTTYCYNDTPYNPSESQAAPYPSVTTTTAISSTMSKTGIIAFDGMGQTIETALTSDPSGNDYTNTSYYGTGKAYQVSNPHRSTSSPTDGTSTYVYDALGRTETVTEPDGSIVNTTYDQLNSTYPSVLCTTVTDEAGKARQSCADGLGRMTSVFEDPGSSPHLGFETDYGYDPLNNLLSVTQKGGSTQSTNWRPRSFAYDSLSRLTQANNPESGTIDYTYDANSNLSTKTAPSPNQSLPNSGNGNPNVSTTYSYDVLNRLALKSYKDTYAQNPQTPLVTYSYDGTTLSCTAQVAGFSSNEVGRRSGMCFSGGSEAWGFDPMGRIKQENNRYTGVVQPYSANVVTLNGVKMLSYDTTYNYYLNGDLLETFYPSGSDYEFSNTENAAGQVIAAGDAVYTDFRNGLYTPTGQLSSGLVGWADNGYTGTTLSNSYNCRLQPVQMSAATASGASVINLTYNFNAGTCPSTNGGTDNGNVISITNGKNSNRSQNFLYDPLNRIWQAYTNGTNWGETYSNIPEAAGTPFVSANAGIDAWGDLNYISGVTGKTEMNSLSCPATVSNQLPSSCGFQYDAAGNLTLNNGVSYTYDAEKRLIATAGTSYIYDGDGKRFQKCTEATTPGACTSNATGMFYFMNNVEGGTIAESDLSGNWLAAYGHIRGQMISRMDLPANTVHYYFHDHLGSTNVVTDAVGNILNESDFTPYGKEVVITSGDSNRYKFTGKERDAESGLDMFGARYYGGSLGRFMTPDWAAKPVTVPYAKFGDPQTLNLYAYVENGPVNKADADGHCADGDTGPECKSLGKDNPANKVQPQMRQEIHREATDSNKKAPGDPHGGNHEEAGEAHNNQSVVAPAVPGAAGKLTHSGANNPIESDPFKAKDPGQNLNENSKPDDAVVQSHAHPGGTDTVTVGPQSTDAGISTTYGGTYQVNTAFWQQTPSPVDIKNALPAPNLNVEVGAGTIGNPNNKPTVYFYTSVGTTCYVPLSQF